MPALLGAGLTKTADDQLVREFRPLWDKASTGPDEFRRQLLDPVTDAAAKSVARLRVIGLLLDKAQESDAQFLRACDILPKFDDDVIEPRPVEMQFALMLRWNLDEAVGLAARPQDAGGAPARRTGGAGFRRRGTEARRGTLQRADPPLDQGRRAAGREGSCPGSRPPVHYRKAVKAGRVSDGGRKGATRRRRARPGGARGTARAGPCFRGAAVLYALGGAAVVHRDEEKVAAELEGPKISPGQSSSTWRTLWRSRRPAKRKSYP